MNFLSSISFKVRCWICGGYLGVIAILSLLPAAFFPASATDVPGADLWAHVAMYGLLGALLRWAAGPFGAMKSARWLPVAGAAYGFLMELLQRFFCDGTRSFSWSDALANLVGVVLFWCLTAHLLKKH